MESDVRSRSFYLGGEIVLAGLFPVITALSYAGVPAVVSFLWSTIFASVFFAAILTYRRRWRELMRPLIWKYSFFIALCIGVLFYGCYFLGLASTTPGNAALMALFEVCTTFVFFALIGKRAPSGAHVLGAFLMVLGAAIVLSRNFSGFHGGDLLVLFGTFFTPAGNYLQQKARVIASGEAIMFLRNLISIPFIIVLVFLMRTDPTTGVVSALPILILNGAVLLGLSKFFWIEAIHRIEVPKAVALQALDVLATLLFAWLILAQAPSFAQVLSLVPFLLGVVLLTDQITLRPKLA